MQKHVNLVDLVKSFPTNIYLQNLASIQKRTSPVEFAHLAEKSGKGSISNFSTKARARAPVRRGWRPGRSPHRAGRTSRFLLQNVRLRRQRRPLTSLPSYIFPHRKYNHTDSNSLSATKRVFKSQKSSNVYDPISPPLGRQIRQIRYARPLDTVRC